MDEVFTETLRRVVIPGENVYLEIGLDESGCGLELRTITQESIDWFGQVRFTMSPSFAQQLGETLIISAKELA